MKKLILLSIAALTLAVTGASAADNTAKPVTSPDTQNASKVAPLQGKKDWTLAEARQHAHEYADRLDKMTEAEWAEKEKSRHAYFDKLNKMSPEEKEAFFKARHERRAEKAGNQAGVPAGAPKSDSKPFESK